jgi:tetratricopeptide (TPR) repeat protein
VLARNTGAFPLLYALGVVHATAKRFDRAEDRLTAALRAKPDDVSTLRALARVARARGNLEKALAHLVHARRVAPDSAGVLFDFGAVALEMDLLLDALPVFEQLNLRYPDEPAYVYALAATRLRKGEKSEAARLMRSYVQLRTKDPSGYFLLGVALHSLNQFPEARAALEQSLTLGTDPQTEYMLGVVYYDEGDLEKAVEVLRRVVAARPDHAAAHSALGTALRDLGDIAAARAALERAVALDPNDLRAHYQLGLVYGRLGEKDASAKMLERAELLRSDQRKRETVLLKLVDPPQN